MLLTISYSESASSITPVEPLKPHFYTILKFVYFLVVNNKNPFFLLTDFSRLGTDSITARNFSCES